MRMEAQDAHSGWTRVSVISQCRGFASSARVGYRDNFGYRPGIKPGAKLASIGSILEMDSLPSSSNCPATGLTGPLDSFLAGFLVGS